MGLSMKFTCYWACQLQGNTDFFAQKKNKPHCENQNNNGMTHKKQWKHQQPIVFEEWNLSHRLTHTHGVCVYLFVNENGRARARLFNCWFFHLIWLVVVIVVFVLFSLWRDRPHAQRPSIDLRNDDDDDLVFFCYCILATHIPTKSKTTVSTVIIIIIIGITTKSTGPWYFFFIYLFTLIPG